MRQPRQRAARARRVRASGRHRALSTLPRGDASRTRVRGQQSSRLLAAEEGESHLGNRLRLWPSTCWRRRSKEACRRASPLTAAVATRRRPRSKSCCASCPLRPSSRRCAHAAGEAAGRRGHLREEDAHLRRPLPARGRLPRPEGTMAGRRRLCRLPPLAAATGCGRWTSTWMTCCAARAAARSWCRRASLLAADVATTRRHSRWLHRHWRHGDAATWARCSLHSCVRLGGLGASEMADASAQRRLCPARASSSSHAANRSGVSRLCESRGACGPAKKINMCQRKQL